MCKGRISSVLPLLCEACLRPRPGILHGTTFHTCHTVSVKQVSKDKISVIFLAFLLKSATIVTTLHFSNVCKVLFLKSNHFITYHIPVIILPVLSLSIMCTWGQLFSLNQLIVCIALFVCKFNILASMFADCPSPDVE